MSVAPSPAPGGLRIGELARATGETVKTLRYWHMEGLMEAERSESGYRLFAPDMVERASLLRRAQALGLTLADAREVLRLREAGVRPCEHVRDRVAQRLEDVRRRLRELRALEAELTGILARARREPTPPCNEGCAYLEPAAGATGAPAARRSSRSRPRNLGTPPG